MKKIMLALTAVMLIACAKPSMRIEGTMIDKAKILNIKPGETTRAAIIEAFGNPTETSFEDNIEKLYFIYRERKVPAYFGGLVENETGGKVTTTTLEVTLSDSVVQSYNFKSTQN